MDLEKKSLLKSRLEALKIEQSRQRKENERYSIAGPEFRVRKGCGEYRLFISTGSELIGLRDNGEQELLIDIDSDLVNNGTIIDCLKTQYYNGLIKNTELIPVDETRFLGFVALPGGSPDNAPLTYAFSLTPKH